MTIKAFLRILESSRSISSFLKLAAMFVIVSSIGCGPGIPPVAEVTGTVTKNGDPLPHVRVEFFPLQDGLDGGYMASGITDADGNYTLSHKGGSVAGVTACLCKVTISEGPMPPEIRAMGQAGAEKLKRFRSKLKNRPIPSQYGALGTTPLEFTVDKDDPVNDFELGTK